MVSTLTLVLAGVLLYTVVAMTLRQRGVLPEYVKVSGPLTTIHTQRGKALLDRLARRKRFWRAWGNVGVGIALLFLIALFLTVVLSAYQNIVSPELTPIRSPQDALVIPGVNRFLPLAAAPDIVFGLLVGLVVHEGGHGLLCRVEDIDIDSMGVALFTILPIGAFVEPDEESRKKANRGAQTRMFAAGVTNNFAITIIAFALLFGPVTGAIAVADGVPIGGTLDGSPAREAGLGHGDVITGINGTPVANESQLDEVRTDAGSGPLVVSTKDGRDITVNRSVLITRALTDGPLDLSVGETITAVNGTTVRTGAELEAALANRSIATLTVERGSETRTTTGPLGAYAIVAEDAPLARDTDVPVSDPVVVTSVDGQRTLDGQALADVLDGIEPGTTVPVTLSHNGSLSTYNVTLGTNPNTGGALIGVSQITPGITGTVVNDFGIRVYPAEMYLGLVGGDGIFSNLGAGSFGQAIIAILVLPVAAAGSASLGYNFAGFLDPITNFYVVQGPLAALGGGVFVLANFLFWTGWVNLNLGLFNCIPAFPLDGGHILRASAEAILSRTPFDSREHVRFVTTSIGVVMLFSLLIMLFWPTLVS